MKTWKIQGVKRVHVLLEGVLQSFRPDGRTAFQEERSSRHKKRIKKKIGPAPFIGCRSAFYLVPKARLELAQAYAH